MQNVCGQSNNICLFNMDDALVHDVCEVDHIEHLKIIFQKIRETGLKLKLTTCEFLKDICNI